MCIVIFIIVVVFIILALIPKLYAYKIAHNMHNSFKKVDGKICIKCGNVISLNS